MSTWSRFATLDAVLVGVLALGTSLPFTADAGEGLWSAAPTSQTASTTIGVILLLGVLLWGAFTTENGLPASIVQILLGILVNLAAVAGEGDLGSGGSLIALSGLLAAGVGAMGALLSMMGGRARTT